MRHTLKYGFIFLYCTSIQGFFDILDEPFVTFQNFKAYTVPCIEQTYSLHEECYKCTQNSDMRIETKLKNLGIALQKHADEYAFFNDGFTRHDVNLMIVTYDNAIVGGAYYTLIQNQSVCYAAWYNHLLKAHIHNAPLLNLSLIEYTLKHISKRESNKITP